MERIPIKNDWTLKKIYTIFVVSLPIFSVYASGIAGLTLGDILLVLFFIIRLLDGIRLNKFKINRNTIPLLFLVISIPLITMISVLGQYNIDYFSIITRIIRRNFYYLSVVIISSEWFDFETGKKGIVFLGKIGAIYLFVQYIFYYFGNIVLHGYLPFLHVYHENYSQLDYQLLYQNMFRPTSFLLEPAHIARFLLIPLVILMFSDKFKNRYIWSFVISISIFASTSGIGLIAVCLLWSLWIILGIFGVINNKRVPAYYLLIYILIVVGVWIAFNSSVFQSSLARILNSNLFDVKTAGGARFRGYIQFFQLNGLKKIFGMGYGSTPNTALRTWFSGASYMLYGTGIIGFFICLIMFISFFYKKQSLVSKVICIIFLYLFFVDDCFMSHVAVLYFSFMCLG